MPIATARTALASALVWLSLGAAGTAHANPSAFAPDPFDPFRLTEIQPADRAALHVPVRRAHVRARSSFRAHKSRSPYERKKVKLIRYRRPFQFAERDFVLKLRARPKRSSIVQLKLAF